MVCDATDPGRALARDLAPSAEIVSDFDAVLESDVTGVVIATPAETHFDLARRALEAGKDVFVEKPLALHLAQGRALQEMASCRQRILMVGHVLEYHPGVQLLTALVREGALGKVQYVYSNRLSLGKIRREENILWSFAPHDVAVILRLYDALPLQVTATGGAYLQANVADVTVSNLLFDNGRRAHIFVSWLHPFKEQRLVVIGNRKMAMFDDVSKKLTIYDQHVDIDFAGGAPIPIKGEGLDLDYAPTEPLRAECEAFLVAMSTRVDPLTDARSGVRVLSVLEASQRSLMMNGEAVTVPFDTYADTPVLYAHG
jgi:predicted dehydrogenase